MSRLAPLKFARFDENAREKRVLSVLQMGFAKSA